MSRNKADKNANRTVIDVATQLVDSVTQLLFSQITTGSLIVDDQERPLVVDYYKKQNDEEQVLIKSQRSRSIIKMSTIDLDEHKRRIKLFMSQNKKLRRKRQMSSVQMSERSLKLRQQQQKNREDSMSKMLEQRRKQIQKRMQAKKSLMRQIQKSTLQANTTISSIRKRKFLYQQKQEEYYKKVLLPKIEEEKQFLEKKKKLFREPMDMQTIFDHEKNYQTLKMNSRINRSLTISVIRANQQQYHPPQFVPQSYRKVQEEQQRKQLEQQLKKKKTQINQIRKKQFVKKIDQIRQLQRQIQKSKQRQRSSSSTKQQAKAKVKLALNRQQTKSKGNQYLKQLLKNNRRLLTSRRLKPLTSTNGLQTPSSFQTKKYKSEVQIQIIKQQRIHKIHKIRNRRIDEIVNDKSMDEHTKHEKLKYEIQKLDLAVQQKLKQNNDIQTVNQSATIMMNSIHAKLALLGVGSHQLKQ